jgi:hypothetical protein
MKEGERRGESRGGEQTWLEETLMAVERKVPKRRFRMKVGG